MQNWSWGRWAMFLLPFSIALYIMASSHDRPMSVLETLIALGAAGAAIGLAIMPARRKKTQQELLINVDVHRYPVTDGPMKLNSQWR